MYSKELNQLMDAVAAEGILTEQNIAVVRKRALKEGEDPDEVEVILKGKIKNAQKPKVVTVVAPTAPQPVKSTSAVKKVKCPYCGSTDLIDLVDGTYKCKECGQIVKPDLKGQTGNIASSLVGESAKTVDSIAQGNKNKFVAAIFALFLGDWGAQYFYLREYKKGIICCLITITVIGYLLTHLWGIFYAIRMLSTDTAEFNRKYNGHI